MRPTLTILVPLLNWLQASEVELMGGTLDPDPLWFGSHRAVSVHLAMQRRRTATETANCLP